MCYEQLLIALSASQFGLGIDRYLVPTELLYSVDLSYKGLENNQNKIHTQEITKDPAPIIKI